MNNNLVSKKQKENPVQNAHPLSQLCFLYMLPIFKRTYKKEMIEDDIFEPLTEHKSSILGDQLEEQWKEEFRKSKHKATALHRALFRLFGFRFILYGLVQGIDKFLMVILLPVSIGKVVSYFENGEGSVTRQEVYLYSFFISFTFLFDTVAMNPTFMGLSHSCMKMRIACSTLLYKKALRLSQTSLSKTTVGQIINLLSNDVSKFDEGFILFHFLWIAPLQACIGTYLIYLEIGISAFFGIAFLLAFIPLQIWVGKRTSTLRLRTALRTDERVKLMNEIITGIQVIKMYCWEKPFAKLIQSVRKGEMKAIRAHQYLIGLIYALEMFITRTSIFISVLTFVLIGNFLTAEKVFAVTGIYNVIRPFITTTFAISISSIAEVNVSVKRINTFLCHEDFIKDRNNQSKIVEDQIKKIKRIPSITLRGVDAKWLSDANENDLEVLNLSIAGNQLVAIIGPVGSGKSSLIHLLLGELTVVKGNMEIKGDLSYASQEPWLFAGSIKQNILFGEDYDAERYQSVVEVCALAHDFELFPNGDETLVGERGKILSGGQRARVNLARCVYKKADIYLLDDPLSAVDVNVGKHLYFKCIDKYLRDKICILVTHQLQYLHTANNILIMEDGRIQQSGSYEELQRRGMNFAKLLERQNSADTNKAKEKLRSRQQSVISNLELEQTKELIQDEEKMAHGEIKFETYYEYARAGGNLFLITFLIALFITGHIITFGGDYFITYWVNVEEDLAMDDNSNSNKRNLSREQIIYIYSAISLGTIIFALWQATYFMTFFTKAAINLHNSTFDRLMKATMSFFNDNLSGRILNRFSEDIGIVDDYIPHILYDVTTVTLLYISVIVITSSVEILMLPASLILTVIFMFWRSIYLKTSRNVKRLVAITRSPMYSHITASIHGITTIRASNAETLLIDEFNTFLDKNSSANYLYFASSECFSMWINFICSIFISLTTFFLITYSHDLHGGSIGLIVTEFIGFLGALDWGMRQWSELENQMTSTERVIEYNRIAIEPNRTLTQHLPEDWPTHGRLEFRNVHLKYKANDDYVLKDISFIVEPKEQIGIVGRTGAGKSSIITSLFQLYPLEGSIIIDGIDTTKIPFEDLRNKISIIPQEPVLFSGTMRKNLDPFDEYSDEVLWNALEEVELKETVKEMTLGLNSMVSESGSNYSVGERQLVCLARALIRHNRILVLDEATANVDPYTDSLIQKTIRNKFSNCTVLTIAHRLNTVMDSDKIIVMNAGRIEEFDHPHVLLQQGKGFFSSLVRGSGDTMSQHLEKIARENYQKNENVKSDDLG